MGAARGSAGLTVFAAYGENGPDRSYATLRCARHVAFALSVSHEAGALDEMIRMAHDDTSSHRVRIVLWIARR